ncbi:MULTISPECIES: HAD family hydrolase [Pseudonocardia]|jgi:hypothetical protein|uniref:hypothetical protein n=1 Tax=Pseudonocardia TaxID=1847 RepID=UPI000CD32795|nr:hypothetical protein [Pseudonocardia dioxanivorans]GJF03057.1 hypothetical protein PSD17_20180 [Pseudonocardia sp. D17]
MDDLDELWGALDRVAATPRLLVACDFDGALAPDFGDPDNARAEQPSSEALNVLLALPRTTVAVVSRRDPEQVAELMLLSGSKGGLRHVAPEAVAGLRDEVDATAVFRISADGGEPLQLRSDDLGITVLEEGGPEAEAPGFAVEDTEGVAEVLEELARLRRGI